MIDRRDIASEPTHHAVQKLTPSSVAMQSHELPQPVDGFGFSGFNGFDVVY